MAITPKPIQTLEWDGENETALRDAVNATYGLNVEIAPYPQGVSLVNEENMVYLYFFEAGDRMLLLTPDRPQVRAAAWVDQWYDTVT